jgi:site-specific DNA recombinase
MDAFLRWRDGFYDGRSYAAQTVNNCASTPRMLECAPIGRARKDNQMKIAIYARVSTDAQKKDGTIDSQIEALRDYARTHNLNIAFECFDDGYSGTTLDRPGLDQLRDLAQTGTIEGVLILSPDRLSRKLPHQIVLIEEFRKRNVQLIFTNQSFEDTPQSNFSMQIQGIVAEYERANILDRMRRGTIHAVKNGQILGNNAPYGYRFIPKTKTTVTHWEINPEEAKTVRYIYDLYINERLKGTQIVKRLRNEFVTCRGTQWWASAVYAILKNETYTGIAHMFRTRSVEPKKGPKVNAYRKVKNSSKVLRPRDEWVGIPVSAIIDEPTWKKAQELLKQNANQARRNNNKHNYLLRGLVTCGLCGCIASGYVSNKSTYYSCGAKRLKNITSKPHDETIQVNHKPFDEKVWLGLTELLSDPKNIKAQLEKRLQVKKEKLPPSISTNELDKELVQLTTQEKRIIDAYREEVISLEDLKAQKEKIVGRRKVLEDKKRAALSPTEGLGQPKITTAVLGDVSARFQRVMSKANFETKEKLAHLLVNSVTLYSSKAIVKGNIPITKLDVLSTADKTPRSFCISEKLFFDHVQLFIITVQPDVGPAPHSRVEYDLLHILARDLGLALEDLRIAAADRQRADGEHEREDAAEANPMQPPRQGLDVGQRVTQVTLGLVGKHIQNL